MKKFNSTLSTLAILYFLTGFLFAVFFAIYYKWSFYSFLSPGFYSVILTWPAQIPGFGFDLQTYGLSGKPL